MIIRIFEQEKKIVQKIERNLGSSPANCDVCNIPISFSHYYYLCKSCRDKLPKFIQDRIHYLNDYPEARGVLFRKIIEENNTSIGEAE